MPPDVAVNIEGQDIYGELHLTALEAFDLATALMDTVRTLTGEPTSDRPSLRMVAPSGSDAARFFRDQIASAEPR